MTGSGAPGFDKALGIVIEVFPYHELSIRRSIRINEAFREMCVDFADARAALRKSSHTLDLAEEDRRLEWEEIVDRLKTDMSGAIQTYEASLPQGRR